MKKIVLAVVAALSLAGCASSDYKHYKDIQIEFAKAESERYKAMAKIAESGDTTTKVAAMFALQGNQSTQQHNIAAPKSESEVLLQWAGVLMPTAAQIYGIHANKQVAITQSNNSRDISLSTNGTFATLGGQIATAGAAAATVATAGFASNQAIATTGFNTVNDVAGQGFTAVQSTAQSGFTAVQGTAQAGLTAVQNVSQSGLTAVQNTAQTGITAVQGVATTAITNKPTVCATDGTTVSCQ